MYSQRVIQAVARAAAGRQQASFNQALRGCQQRREGDEMACSCGKRWPVGESHP